jgi:hypothetical protein
MQASTKGFERSITTTTTIEKNKSRPKITKATFLSVDFFVALVALASFDDSATYDVSHVASLRDVHSVLFRVRDLLPPNLHAGLFFSFSPSVRWTLVSPELCLYSNIVKWAGSKEVRNSRICLSSISILIHIFGDGTTMVSLTDKIEKIAPFNTKNVGHGLQIGFLLTVGSTRSSEQR